MIWIVVSNDQSYENFDLVLTSISGQKIKNGKPIKPISQNLKMNIIDYRPIFFFFYLFLMLFDYTYRNDVKNDIRFVQLDNENVKSLLRFVRVLLLKYANIYNSIYII